MQNLGKVCGNIAKCLSLLGSRGNIIQSPGFLPFRFGIVFLLIEKDPFVRFHAMQSVITFGALTVLGIFPLIGWVLSPFLMIIGFVLWLVLIFKAYQGEEFKLPMVGEFAKKQLNRVK